MPDDSDSDRRRAVPPAMPRDFVEIPIPCPLEAPQSPRFVALYPVFDGRFALHEGRTVHAPAGDVESDAQTSRWLQQALDYDGGISGLPAVVVDLETRRSWRAPIERAIAFVRQHSDERDAHAKCDAPTAPIHPIHPQQADWAY